MSKTDKTIQQKMDQLSQLVAWFESDEFALEAALDKYQAAQALASEIEADLSQFKNDITVLKAKFDS